MGFPDADGIALGLVVQRDEVDRLLRVFSQDHVLERRFLTLGGKALVILENTVDLDLDASVFAIAKVGRDFQTPIRHGPLLDAGAGYGGLDARIHEDDALM